ncbi:MAG: MFS transporter [Candidatus Aenigmarchaeota archaeon]|nr:MFS transporter [Candidatus Aenigmarchaeota archaeon]
MRNIFFNRALKILLITNSLIMTASAMLGPIYALFVEKIGGNLLDASIAGGVFAFAAGITTLISGRYTDRTKEKQKIVVFGYFLIGIGFLLYIFVNSIWFLFFVQILIGFAQALCSPAFDALYSKHITKTRRGIEWGEWEASSYFSSAFGAVIGGVIVSLFGFNMLFIIMAFFCFSSSLYLCFLPKRIL